MNLVKNSTKFTQSGYIRIEYFYKWEQHKLIVRVIDSGKGIAEKDLPNLFTRYGKLQRTASMNHEGIGLGLNISKQIVEQTGGQIYASSLGLGFGSQFTFSMIMAPEDRI